MISRSSLNFSKLIKLNYISAALLIAMAGYPSSSYAETLLTVVDMQTDFKTSQYDPLIGNVKAAIEKAIQKDQPILFLEFEGFGPTDSRLTELVKGYKKAYFATKYSDDGSRQVKALADQLDSKPTKVKVCGVNASYCVLATVEGILESMKEVEKVKVLSDACGDWSPSEYQNGIKMMKLLDRVVLKELTSHATPYTVPNNR